MRFLQRLASGLAVVLGLAMASVSAFAQDQPAPPVNIAVDPRGVDLPTGKFIYSTTEAAIGQPGQGGISYGRIFIPVQGGDGGNWRDVLMGSISVTGVTNEVLVSIGNSSEIFTKSGTTYTPKRNVGSTLTQSGTVYAYTLSGGAVAEFSAAPANYAGMYSDSIATITSLRQPNGERMDYVYREENVCTAGTYPSCSIYKNIRRVQSITSNRGYQIHYDYATTTAWMSSGWGTKTKVTALNLATDYCSPTAVSCTFTASWPSVTYSAGTATDQGGLVTTYYYSTDNLSGVRLPGSSSNDITITYNADERVQSITSAQGVWSYEYIDNSPNVGVRSTVATGPLGQELTAIVPMTTGLLAATLDANSKSTNYQYDTQGRITRVTQPEGNYTAWHYDAFGNIDTVTQGAKTSGPGSAANIVHQASYPATCNDAILCHRPTSTTDPLGNVTNYSWSGTHGGLLTVTQPAPASGGDRPQTRTTYSARYAYYKDETGTIVQGPSPITLPTASSQCATGVSPACVGTVNEIRTTTVYGSNGVANNLLPTSVTRANGAGTLTATETTTYVANGDPEYVDGPLSGTSDRSRFFWNVRRQMEGYVGPVGPNAGSYRAIQYNYGSRGLPTLIETGTTAGQSRSQWEAMNTLGRVAVTYDGYRRTARRTQQTGSGVAFALQQMSYDAAGRLSCVATRMNTAVFGSLPSSACTASTVGTDGADRITQYSYNINAQLSSTTAGYGTASAQTESITYTDNGKSKTVTDGEGNVSNFAYTRQDQLYRLYYPNPSGAGPSTTDFEEFTYDLNGNVTEFQNRSAQDIHYIYDDLNRLTLLDPPSMSDATYEWDNLGRSLKARFGTAHVVTNVWDALGRVTSQTGRGGTLAYQYDLAGNRTRITWPGGSFYVDYDYDSYNEVTDINLGGGSTLATYTYDGLGHRVGVARANGTSTAYGWNDRQQLVSIAHNLSGTANDLTLSYTYNAAGQIKTRTRSNTAYAYTAYSPTTVNSTIDGLNRVTQQGSTAVGYDSRGEITSLGSATFTYNALNQLTATTSPASSLGYDPMGRLYSLSDGSTDVRFQYESFMPITEFGSNDSTVLRRHVPGAMPDEPLLTYEGTGVANPSWYLSDNLGSVLGASNSSGAGTQINAYDEYGVPALSNVGRFQYTAQIKLPGSLYHYQTRAYSPALGRFLQPDRAGYRAGLNLYAYVRADPINLIDPLGLQGTVYWYNNCVPTADPDGATAVDCYRDYWYDPGLLYQNAYGSDALLPSYFSSYEEARARSTLSNSETGECRLYQAGEAIGQLSDASSGAGAVALTGALVFPPLAAPGALLSIFGEVTGPVSAGLKFASGNPGTFYGELAAEFGPDIAGIALPKPAELALGLTVSTLVGGSLEGNFHDPCVDY